MTKIATKIYKVVQLHKNALGSFLLHHFVYKFVYFAKNMKNGWHLSKLRWKNSVFWYASVYRQITSLQCTWRQAPQTEVGLKLASKFCFSFIDDVGALKMTDMKTQNMELQDKYI